MRCWFLLVMAACVHTLPATSPIDPGMGVVHHAIETRSPEAQRHFDAGLAAAYGFNYDEAFFELNAAIHADPSCAMCWWGLAYVSGPNINAFDKQAPGAYDSAVRAEKLAKSPIERALAKAMQARLTPMMMQIDFKTRGRLDEAYLEAMREVGKLAPTDDDIQTLLAEALMSATPPFIPGWKKDGTPAFPRIDESRQVLEKILARSPDHIGAIHFYIHIVDASPYMEKAVPFAKKLAKLTPHAGHLVHMPSHLYLKLGRYAEADDANRAAIATDAAYLDRSVPGTEYAMFTAHPKQYLWFVLLWEGASAEAWKQAEELRDLVGKMAMMGPDAADQAAVLEPLTAIRFGQWERILALKDPVGPVSAIPVELGRGLAYVAKGQLDEADKQIAKVLAAPTVGQPPAEAKPEASGKHDDMKHDDMKHDGMKHDDVPTHDDHVDPPQMGPDPLLIQKRDEFFRATAASAAAQLSGAVAAARGDTERAISELRRAADLEDHIPDMGENSKLPLPARQRLGAVLLAAGKPAEAEAAYREDLKQNPENGWSLFGLAKALDAQHKP
ncbi:MAG TPA: hypothetical protein VLB44_00160, partial [Kofleriaceae bacterium]|nr:hypothetical protein [Kofleriaceae bacterium]